jgi:hypothetical protein
MRTPREVSAQVALTSAVTASRLGVEGGSITGSGHPTMEEKPAQDPRLP